MLTEKKCPRCKESIERDIAKRLLRIGNDGIKCPHCGCKAKLHPLHSLLLTAVLMYCFLQILDMLESTPYIILLMITFSVLIIFHKYIEIMFPLIEEDEFD